MVKKTMSLVLVTIIFLSSIVGANSGPTYWEGYPSMEILSIQENSPIVVEKENLSFDFKDPKLQDFNDYSKFASVTASYEMLNPSDERVTAQMAFPIISRTSDFRTNDVEITNNGESIPFQIFIGPSVSDLVDSSNEDGPNKIDFDKIVNSITRADYIPVNFQLDDIGRLYKFDVENTSDKGMHFIIDFTYNQEKTKIISNGFNSYHDNQEKNITEVGSYIHRKGNLELFVIGEDIDFNINSYYDSERKEKTDNYSYIEESKDIRAEDYLKNYFDEQLEGRNNNLPYRELLNLYYREIDNILTSTRGFSYMWIDEFIAFYHYDFVFVLLYEVDFMPNESNNVSVSYMSKGTMNRKETVDPLYTFEYILNPASNWSDFKDLNIEIIPPNDSPYVVDSSLELEKTQEGTYQGRYETLPDNDLKFTIYSKERVTFMDKIAAFFDRAIYMIPIFIVPILSILILIAIRLITRIYKKNKEKLD